MKKRNNLTKRLLASVLAVAMCVSTATTVFADEAADDYVYVYVNVKPESVQEGTETTPTFEQFKEEHKDSVDAAQEELTRVDINPTEVENTITNVENDVHKAEVDESKKPEFDKDGKLNNAIETGKEQVNTALDNLENSQPTFPENDGTGGEPVNPLPSDDVPPSEDPKTDGNTTEEPKKSFVEDVTDRVNELEAEREKTEATASSAEEAANAVKDDLEKLNQAAADAKAKLEEAQEKADAAVTAAEKAATEAQAACDKEKEILQNELDAELAKLSKPSETAPVRDSYETQDAYKAAYDAWKIEADAYNTKVEEFQDVYDAKAEALKGVVKAEQDKVDAAKAALNTAKANLAEFEAKFKDADGSYKEIEGTSELITKYNEALKAYKDKVSAYNSAKNEYDTAQNEYNNAVNEYEAKAQEHDQKVTDYNAELNNYNTQVDTYVNTVEKYKQDVATYETAVNNYNSQVVDVYNNQATDWNTQQLEKAEGSIDNSLIEAVKNALKSDITVTSTDDATGATSTANDPWANLSDEEYNKKVQAYNAAVKNYNEKVDTANENLKEKVLADAEAYFHQDGWAGTEDGKKIDEAWYAVGKIDVKNLLGNKGPSDYVEQNAGFTNAYSWEKSADGTWIQTTLNSKIAEGEFDYFIKALEDSSKNLTKDDTYRDITNTGTKKPTDNVYKWVLHSTKSGANQGDPEGPEPAGTYVSNGTPSWHLDGTLLVQQLNKLAYLQERTVAKVTTKQVDEKYGSTVTTLTDSKYTVEKGSFAENARELTDTVLTVSAPTTYTPGEEVGKPNVELIENNWTETPVGDLSFTPGELRNNATPITVTPATTEPIIPPIVDEEEEDDDDDDEEDEITIEDEIVPLAETPAEAEAVIDIPEAEVPLAEAPLAQEEMIDIFDEDVPLAGIQNTGDKSAMWYALTLVCGLALLVLRKKENS